MATRPPSTVVLAALALSTISALVLFAAAAWTGSSALLAVAIQALIGATSQSLLLYGLRKAAAAPGGAAGYEMYFWSFGVAVLLFSLGAGIAIYDGVAKLAEPLPNRYHHIAFTALAGTFVLAVAATYLALKNLSAPQPLARTAPRGAEDAAASTIVIEGLAGLLGIAIAAAGIVIAQMLGAPAADGYAAIAVGLVLGVVAAFMSLEIRTLLVRTGKAQREHPAEFFIEDEPAPETAGIISERPAAQPAVTAAAPRAAPVSAPLATTAPAPPARPLSRKERKRQKHKR